MSREEKFEFDIANLRNDLAIENMQVKEEDVVLLRKHYDNEMTIEEIIDGIKKTI